MPPIGRVFVKFYTYVFFKNPRKNQVLLKSDRISRYFISRQIYIFLSYLSVFLRMKNVSAKFIDIIGIHFVFSDFFPENRAVYEIMWNKMLDSGTGNR
jgi:hypothetical protein